MAGEQGPQGGQEGVQSRAGGSVSLGQGRAVRVLRQEERREGERMGARAFSPNGLDFLGWSDAKEKRCGGFKVWKCHLVN